MKTTTQLPTVKLAINGRELANPLYTLLEQLHVSEKISCPAQCEMVFHDKDRILSSSLKPGEEVSLSVADRVLFHGQITACYYEFGPARQRSIRVRCYDLLHQLRKRRRVEVYLETHVSDLAKMLTRDFKITIESHKRGPLIERLVQYQQSDFDLLRDATENSALNFILRDQVLHIMDNRGFGAHLPMVLGESLLQAGVEINAETLCRSVTATGWDPRNSETFHNQIDGVNPGWEVAAPPDLSEFNSDGKWYVLDQAIQNNDQGEALASACHSYNKNQEVRFWGVAEGDAQLHPGAVVDVSGLHEGINGRFMLTAVHHRINMNEGYVTELSSQPRTERKKVRSTAVSLGTVSKIDDPENLGRVKVMLNNYNNIESDWCQVVVPAAGAQKGLIALPDVEDQVLVLLVNGDPSHTIVLGGLFGNIEPPDTGVVKGRRQRFHFASAGGHQLVLDDADKTIKLADTQGNYVLMSRDTMTIHAANTLILEAPGDRILIQGDKIDFNKA